jgi:excisionase family DNA binding protein
VKEDRIAFSPQEAAEKLGVHVATIYRLVDRGELRAIRLGGRGDSKRTLRIPAEALDAYLGNTTEPMCDNYGCRRPVAKRLRLPRQDGHVDTYVCAVHWALDYEGRLGKNVEVSDITTTEVVK